MGFVLASVWQAGWGAAQSCAATTAFGAFMALRLCSGPARPADTPGRLREWPGFAGLLSLVIARIDAV